MKISEEHEVIIRDLDELKKALGEITLVKKIMKLYFLGHKPKNVFKVYIKSRIGLKKLLKKDKWEPLDTIEAIKAGIKICGGRDYIDSILEYKEKELEFFINHLLIIYPQLIDLSLPYLNETYRRLMESSSYIHRLINKLISKKNIIDENYNFNPLFVFKNIFFHPMQRYSSHADFFLFSENMTANRRVKIINTCRKKLFGIIKGVVSSPIYKKFTLDYNELNKLIKMSDKQEELEKGDMNDLILVDSLLKNLCPHTPSHYKDSKNAKEFLNKLITCPKVKELLSIDPIDRTVRFLL